MESEQLFPLLSSKYKNDPFSPLVQYFLSQPLSLFTFAFLESIFRFDVEDRSYLTSTSGVAGSPVMINSGLLRNCLRMLLSVLLFLC